MSELDIPTYRRIVADIRRRIEAGELVPGTRIPPEASLQAEYGCARETVRRAIQVLYEEGVVQADGLGRFVRRRPEINVLAAPAGSRVIARMPTPQERAERDMPSHVPVLLVTEPDGEVGVYPADATEVVFLLPPGPPSGT